MKRHKNLYAKLCSFDNLILAAKNARKGKRFILQVMRFHDRLEQELLSIQKELVSHTYQPGMYRPFWIHDKGKQRYISSAPYRDRVVHHVLINIIGPVFERTFIFDSYANRKGKGTHKGLDRCQDFSRNNQFVLKCDISKYFPSIDHEILKQIVRQKLADADVLWLVDTIIDASNAQEPVCEYFPGDDLWTPFNRRKGIPIGNLTSQFFANMYLNGFDHFVKETLLCKAYLRYVDDFLCFHQSKELLHEIRHRMTEYLQTLRLKLHPKKSRVFPVKSGIPFLGFRVYPNHRRLCKRNSMAFRRRLRHYSYLYRIGEKELADITPSVQGWLAHAFHGDTYRLRRQLFSEIRFKR